MAGVLTAAPPARADRAALEEEARALVASCEPDATATEVRFG